jgi:hypothetical protein
VRGARDRAVLWRRSSIIRHRAARSSPSSTAGAPQERIEKIVVDGRSGRYTIALDAEPSAVRLDPQVWLLFEARFEKR